jgi:quinoprotein relay system zinc metallohydrolase 2
MTDPARVATERPQHKLPPTLLARRQACGCMATAVLCCLPGLRAQAAALAADSVELVEVAPGIHVFRGAHEEATAENLGAIANIGVVIGKESVAVVDTGGSLAWGERLRAAIHEVTPLPVRHVINTHVHPDHMFGNGAFAADAPEIWGHAKLPAALATRGQFYLGRLLELLGDAAKGTQIVPPTRLVETYQTLDLGGRILQLQAYPTAHTDNDLAVVDAASGTLLAGDLLFMERLPAIDGSLNGWISVLDGLRQFRAERVVPGHGPAAASLSAAINPMERYLRLLRTEIRALIADGVPMEKAVDTVGQAERGAWKMFDDYNARNVVTAYAELEWE